MKKLNLFSLLLLFACLTIGCQQEKMNSISVQEFDQLRQNFDIDHIIIDVRTPEEFEEGYVSGAINIDVKSDSFDENIGTFDRKNNYIVYCRSGKRSAKAYAIMKELGFTNLLNVDGGYLKYKDEILNK